MTSPHETGLMPQQVRDFVNDLIIDQNTGRAPSLAQDAAGAARAWLTQALVDKASRRAHQKTLSEFLQVRNLYGLAEDRLDRILKGGITQATDAEVAHLLLDPVDLETLA